MNSAELKRWTTAFAPRNLKAVEAGLVKGERLAPLLQDANERVAITVASINQARRKLQ
jgi:hypothetical protein